AAPLSPPPHRTLLMRRSHPQPMGLHLFAAIVACSRRRTVTVTFRWHGACGFEAPVFSARILCTHPPPRGCDSPRDMPEREYLAPWSAPDANDAATGS